MAYEEKRWEEELLELIRETEQEKERAVQQLESAKEAITTIDNKFEAMQTTLDAYCRKYGLARPTELRESLASEYVGMTPEERLQHEDDTRALVDSNGVKSFHTA